MCNRYISPEVAEIERAWHVGARDAWRGGGVYPRSQGPFIRRSHEGQVRELQVGQWGLIPWFAKSPKLSYSTNNCRFEEIASKASFRDPWKRGQRCIIPAVAFDEPCWETGKNVWWTFRRADKELWGLAGIWAEWKDPATGEIVPSYSMLTLNADAHPLMSRMHKPDPKLGPDAQDKRSVVPIEMADVDAWLFGSVSEAAALVRLADEALFDGAPTPLDAAAR